MEVREKFLLLKAGQMIKGLLKKYIICKGFSSTAGDQTVAPLPPDRVQ